MSKMRLLVLLLGAWLPPWSVPGLEAEMQTLGAMHQLHLPHARSQCTLWDGWLPHATLWTGPNPREFYRRVLTQRRLDPAGYVAMQQHRGMAHSNGWPFPAWQQSTGRGWHFSLAGDGWAIQNFRSQPLRHVDHWDLRGVEVLGIDEQNGLQLSVTDDLASISVPAFQCGTIVAPFVRLEWSGFELEESAAVELVWTVRDPNRDEVVTGEVALTTPAENMAYLNAPLYQQPGYAGLLEGLQLRFRNAKGARIHLKSIITAIDTRHPITGALFVQGCTETFRWTKDVDFLRKNLERMRRAIDYALHEFDVLAESHVRVPWVGHGGRSGLTVGPAGQTQMRVGLGVGNNYWDLLPFGGHDALATIYLYDALRGMVELEDAIARHPEWDLPLADDSQNVSALTLLTDRIREDFQARFWNPETERFVGWIDLQGRAYDYGFTFVNLEAIHFGLATEVQQDRIMQWINGDRIVPNETSQGDDIYHWRLAPRATTKRNVETYVWAWSDPGSIPWGDQVQDGGAVLGFSYHDLMARLKVEGPDPAWQRFEEILDWFDEVQAAGGYRAYYRVPGRGKLQGGGTAGGLGMDREFMESILLPQVMLYGFLGFQPTAEGFEVHPRLPSAWPSLTIRGIHIGDQVLDITARQNGDVQIQASVASGNAKD